MSKQVIAYFGSASRAAFAVNSLHDCGVRDVHFWTEVPFTRHHKGSHAGARIGVVLDHVRRETVMHILNETGDVVVHGPSR